MKNMIKKLGKEERKMKIKAVIIVCFLTCIFMSSAKASEYYYTNNQGINFTKEEYDYISKIYWEGYQNTMDLNSYNRILEKGLPINVETKEYMPLSLFSEYHETKSKKMKIAKSNFGSYSLITISVEWITNPVVRSYDVIGAYLEGPKLVTGSIYTEIFSDTNTIQSNEIKQSSNGFGVSIKLPKTEKNLKVSQSFRVTGSGHIYASYQHAKKSITLVNSKKYTISKSGYGKVFEFDNTVKNYYDAMGGVDINI